MFAGHAEQLRFCTAAQLDAPLNEYKPVAHVEQVPRLDAPATPDAVPPGHRVQALTPAPLEYVPAAQFVQLAVLIWPLYVPAMQAVQGPPIGPVYPALHSHTSEIAVAYGMLLQPGHPVMRTS